MFGLDETEIFIKYQRTNLFNIGDRCPLQILQRVKTQVLLTSLRRFSFSLILKHFLPNLCRHVAQLSLKLMDTSNTYASKSISENITRCISKIFVSYNEK
jgi:hypothetical protein